jgi:hypothetical protein
MHYKATRRQPELKNPVSPRHVCFMYFLSFTSITVAALPSMDAELQPRVSEATTSRSSKTLNVNDGSPLLSSARSD